MAKVTIEKAFENLVSDTGVLERDQAAFIGFLRFLEQLDRYHAEDVSKKIITFMKVHGDKLEEVSNEQLHGVYETLIQERKERESRYATAYKAKPKNLVAE